jgi:hypothetical protein
MGSKAALQDYSELVESRARLAVTRLVQDDKDITKQIRL